MASVCRRLLRWIAVPVATATVWVWCTAAPAFAAVNDKPTKQLEMVLAEARNWLLGILSIVVILMLTIAGMRYTIGAGDPAETEKAKSALKAALLGLVIALMAPVFVEILKGILGH